MEQTKLREVLLIEVWRLIEQHARNSTKHLGGKVPIDALASFLTPEDLIELKKAEFGDFQNPYVQKAMQATIARNAVLPYPPDGEVTEEDAEALESIKLSPAQLAVLQRVIADAIQSAFFHFFAMLDSVGDPEVSEVTGWGGADFTSPCKEGDMLHDDFGPAYYEYRKRTST